MNTVSLASRKVIVTGAAGGIGTVFVRALLGAGHAVAAVDRDAGALGNDQTRGILDDAAVDADAAGAVVDSRGGRPDDAPQDVYLNSAALTRR